MKPGQDSLPVADPRGWRASLPSNACGARWTDREPVTEDYACVPHPGAPFGGSVQSVMNWRPYGPLSKREIRCRRLSYRFSPPIPARLNRFQRMLWRLQRLFLGDTQHKRVQPWRSDARETA